LNTLADPADRPGHLAGDKGFAWTIMIK
jgi:hypothetical protein